MFMKSTFMFYKNFTIFGNKGLHEFIHGLLKERHWGRTYQLLLLHYGIHFPKIPKIPPKMEAFSINLYLLIWLAFRNQI